MTKATVRALAGVRFDSIDPDTLLDLGRLGLTATGQRITSHAGGREELVVEARPVIADDDERLLCTVCGAQGRRKSTVARLLAHTPTADRLTRLLVRVPEIACKACAGVWRLDMSATAAPRSVLTHRAVHWALAAVAVDNMAVSRVAAHLGVGWDTVNNAVLDAGLAALGDVNARLEGVRVLGVDEHVVRHEALLYRMEVRDLHGLAVVAVG